MDVQLSAQTRTKTGKGGARSLRREELVPAVLYGPRTEPVPISISAKRLERILQEAGRERLIALSIDGEGQGSPRHVLIREVQTHPVRKQFLHVDFYEVAMDQPIVMDVPVELVGEFAGAKLGGVLDLLRRTLAVRCLPSEIPEKVQIDIGGLNVGDRIHVSDLIGKVPFELVDDPSFTVITVSGPEAAAPAAPAEQGGEQAAGE